MTMRDGRVTKRACLRGLAGIVIMAAAFFAGWKSPIFGGQVGKLTVVSTQVLAATPPTNACGCYRDSAGSCFCGKKGKCACPGDCEPKGCDEKRARQLEKEIAEETKKATAADAHHAAKGKVPAASREDGEAGDQDAKGSRPKDKPAHLTTAQKKDLLRLLDAYLAEHPEGKSQTINELRSALTPH
jgi:hypothetical protein